MHLSVCVSGYVYAIKILFSTSFLIRIIFTHSVGKLSSLIRDMLASIGFSSRHDGTVRATHKSEKCPKGDLNVLLCWGSQLAQHGC